MKLADTTANGSPSQTACCADSGNWPTTQLCSVCTAATHADEPQLCASARIIFENTR
jgi:hypothetical protein